MTVAVGPLVTDSLIIAIPREYQYLQPYDGHRSRYLQLLEDQIYCTVTGNLIQHVVQKVLVYPASARYHPNLPQW